MKQCCKHTDTEMLTPETASIQIIESLCKPCEAISPFHAAPGPVWRAVRVCA